jgi:MFS family permease
MMTASMAPIANDLQVAKAPVALFGMVLPALVFAIALNRIFDGIGRPFFGWVSDYIGRELSAVLTYGTSIIGVACALLITSPDQHLLLWLHSCFFGLTWGARGPAITAKTADLFPGPRLGTILGAITIGTGIGSASGSWLAGWSFDVTGSYHVAFWLSIFFYVCGGVAFWMVRRPPRQRLTGC